MKKKIVLFSLLFAIFVPALYPVYTKAQFPFGGYTYRQPKIGGNLDELLKNKAIPKDIRETLPSHVSVRVYRPNVLLERLVFVSSGMGFVVDDHRVLTKFHVAASMEGGYYFDDQHTIITVAIKGFAYETRFVGADPENDLLLLKVVDDDVNPLLKFDAKPLILSYLSVDELTPFNGRGVHHDVIYRDPFFAFGVPRLSEYPSNDVFFPKRWTADEFYGYFVGSRSVADGSPNRLGLLGGSLEPGFSGSPILDRFGRVVGTHGWGTGTSATFTPADKIINFLYRVRGGELEKQGQETINKKGD